MAGFEELNAWKACRNFRITISELVKTFPSDEKYRLSDQIVRSSRSSTANIAEGHGRFHYQENIQYCRMDRGSLNETLDHLICAADNGYITIEKLNALRKDHDACVRILNGYLGYLKKKRDE